MIVNNSMLIVEFVMPQVYQGVLPVNCALFLNRRINISHHKVINRNVTVRHMKF